MKNVVYSLILTVFIITFSPFNTFSQPQPVGIGAGILLSSGVLFGEIDNEMGIRSEILYTLSDRIKGEVDFTYYFPKRVEENEKEALASVISLNFNGHYLIYKEDNFAIYSLGGINIAIINTDVPDEFESPLTDIDDDTELGLNLGGGVEYALDFGDLFGELKFAGVGGDADQLVFGFGVRFPIN